jgi:hypothetical protein
MSILNPFDNIAKTTIDGYDFQINKLRTSLLIRHGTKLAKVIIPILAEKAMQDKLKTIDLSALADLFVENIDEMNLEELTPLLLNQASVNGGALDIEEFFRGKFLTLMKVIKWTISVNFLNFSDASMEMSGFIQE